jgi:hypothetical protein
MSNTIVLNIELSPEALRRQADMLGQMATVREQIPEAKKKSGSASEQLIHELDAGNTSGMAAPMPTPPVPAIAPAPVAIASIPAPPAAPQAPSPGIVGEVDADGLPWDGRIHSSSKKKTADNRWKVARNMDPELVKRVRGELIALRDAANGGAAPAAPAAPAPAPVVSMAPPAPPAPPAAPPFVNLMTGQPPAPAAPAPVVSADDPAESAKRFTLLLQHISGLINTKQITAPQVNEALAKLGIPQLGLLNKRPDLYDTVRADIDNTVLQNQIAAAQ